jgi:hypothetical protein
MPQYSQLEAARASITNPQPVRIAILDVGFDFQHRSVPEHLRRDLERNFTGDGRTDASDPDIEGFLQNPGHGTATIALLAGRQLKDMRLPTPNGSYLGGAPQAEIVPLRIASSVVLLSTSAFAEALEHILSLQSNPNNAVDIVSMSMGGVASDAWADVVNRAYEAGLCLVTAAGNNFGRPKSIVFPARFRRVLAACGVMADFQPYELGFGQMSGNYGPDSKMDTAVAAFTPNVPWAEIGAPDVIDWDGQGTSSVTPQVAAAAALWLQQHKTALAGWEGWAKIEMIRQALFQSADTLRPDSRKYFGQGILKAHTALGIEPTPARRQALQKQPPDTASFAFWRLLRGTIFTVVTEESPLDHMFELELAQLIHRDGTVEATVADPEKGPSKQELEAFRDAALSSPYLSRTLRRELERRSGRTPSAPGLAQPTLLGPADGGKGEYHTPQPLYRRLRVFSFDPSTSGVLDTADINQTVVTIPWESVSSGPSGEYLEVVDHDPASGCFYAPVDLNDAYLIAADGLAPAEGNPMFHQQMVYAVAMRTIHTFEEALGRKALWSPRVDGVNDATYVQKLRIYPHALRDRNAYYNPLKKALLFGYFPARPLDPARLQPGGMVFTCLSHDVVAHETAHALLDGMARGLVEPTNPDMLAFHEAFADVIALFQHFALPGILEHQIGRVRGNLRDRNLLGELAQQFGLGYGLHGALRSYIGCFDAQGNWEHTTPSATDYVRATEQHERGAVLVAAIFDTFLSVYERRIADLKRIASEGTGVLRAGDLHPDLVRRFADEARTAAVHVLKSCIRAIDYCPPVDLTFGDFLRAAITVDYDLFPDDALGYRVALIESFRERGIYPGDVRTMSEDTLRWKAPEIDIRDHLGDAAFVRLRATGDIVRRLSNLSKPVPWPVEEMRYLRLPAPQQRPTRSSRRVAAASRSPQLQPREAIFRLLRQERAVVNLLWSATIPALEASRREVLARTLGLDFTLSPSGHVRFEIRALNFANRSASDGLTRREAILWLQQVQQPQVDGVSIPFEGGCTLIIDLDTAEVRYAICKNINSASRRRAIRDFRAQGNALGLTYFGGSPLAGPGHRFAMIHSTTAQEETYA